MSNKCLSPLLFFFAFIFLSTSIQAQDYIASNDFVSPDEISMVYRLQKRLSAVYDGYAIEVESSEFPVGRSHPMFKQFGKIYYDKLREGGYSYVIKAEFSDLKSVKQFCNTVIKPKVNEARIFEYNMGKRKLRE